MIAVLFGLLAALANAGQALISKELTYRAPARQLIGVLYVGNALVLLPFAPFATWVWSPAIVLLHLVSVALMVVTAICVWDLLDHGAASATTTATAMSPIPAVLAAAILLPGTVDPLQIVAAVVVVGGVLYALADAFSGLGRWGRIVSHRGCGRGEWAADGREPAARGRGGRAGRDVRRADGAGRARVHRALPAT